MDATLKYIDKHTQLQELLGNLLNRPKLFGINRYGRWGPIKSIVAILKVVCIGDVEKDGILVIGIQLIQKKQLHIYLKEHINKERLKECKYRICVVHKYSFMDDKTAIQLDNLFIITNPKKVEEKQESLDINVRTLSTTCWRDVGDDQLVSTYYTNELNRLFNITDDRNKIEIDIKKILVPVKS